ncbi:unnamed protein product [Arctogadus glacialis]
MLAVEAVLLMRYTNYDYGEFYEYGEGEAASQAPPTEPPRTETKAEEYYTGEYDYGTVDGSQTDPQPDSTTPDQTKELARTSAHCYNRRAVGILSSSEGLVDPGAGYLPDFGEKCMSSEEAALPFSWLSCQHILPSVQDDRAERYTTRLWKLLRRREEGRTPASQAPPTETTPPTELDRNETSVRETDGKPRSFYRRDYYLTTSRADDSRKMIHRRPYPTHKRTFLVVPARDDARRRFEKGDSANQEMRGSTT